MTRRALAPALLAALGCLAVALGGCGIPTEATARTISPSQVPAHVVTPPPTTTPTTVVGSCSSGCIQVAVYLTATGTHLVAETRSIPGTSESLTAVLESLLKGPDVAELRSGIQSALGTQVKLFSPAHVAGGVVTVNLNAAFGEISGTQEILAVAQVVYTVSAATSAAVGIQFEIDDAQTEVPLATGALTPGPVHESQYASLLSPPASA